MNILPCINNDLRLNIGIYPVESRHLPFGHLFLRKQRHSIKCGAKTRIEGKGSKKKKMKELAVSTTKNLTRVSSNTLGFSSPCFHKSSQI